MFIPQNLTYMIFFPTFLILANAAPLQENSGQNSLAGVPGSGKKLAVRSYPAIENYQSDLFEIHHEPYGFDIRQQAAIAVLASEDGGVRGEVVFVQKHPPGGPIFIRGNITGLTSGRHGLHIFQAGDLREGCSKLGEHFNPYLMRHGGPRSPIHHVGDLGNVEAKDDGVAEIVTINPLLSLLGGPRGIVGRALVVTEDEDDLGLGGNANSFVDGNAGKAVACGIIAYIR